MGRNKSITARMRAETMYDEGIRYISGKWFTRKGEEISYIERYIIKMNNLLIDDKKDVTEALDFFVMCYGDLSGWWPKPPIVEKALKQAELRPLAFPLNEYQLMIINRLLFGREEYMFILTGIGGSGKSTFANIIKQIFNNDVASLSLGDLSEGFMLATGVNKRLIYSDELDVNEIKSSIIKTLISKQGITVNPKFQQPINIRWQGNLLFSCNQPPRLDIVDSGLLRRICYYSMNTKIENPDPLMKDKVFTEDDLVNIVAHALKMDTTDWFDRYFRRDTYSVLMSKNSVYRLWGETTYDNYSYQCYKRGYKAYNFDNWQAIRNIFTDWMEEEPDLDEDDEGRPF